MESPTITFSFGENWKDLVSNLTENDVSRAVDDISFWLDKSSIENSRVIDVGCGSGIHSLAFLHLGARFVHSFDYDVRSVEATQNLRSRMGSPESWSAEQGSILDRDYVSSLGTFDIVYSWGVLHHTGALWEALDNCCLLLGPSSRLWISIYAKGPRYQRHLALKQRFNTSSPAGKRWLLRRQIAYTMLHRLRRRENPLKWNQKKARGMDTYHDIVDWLGGLPYETASEDEVVRFGRSRGLVLERIRVAPEGACSKYVFSRREDVAGLGHESNPSKPAVH